MTITLQDLLTSSGKYPERAESKELTQQLKNNGVKLLENVNALLHELKIENVTVSSGFRPSDINAKIPNAAKRSLHTVCRAVDLKDSDGKIDELIKSKPELLRKYNLWLENPDNTVGWCHLDDSDSRTDREIRIFKP